MIAMPGESSGQPRFAIGGWPTGGAAVVKPLSINTPTAQTAAPVSTAGLAAQDAARGARDAALLTNAFLPERLNLALPANKVAATGERDDLFAALGLRSDLSSGRL